MYKQKVKHLLYEHQNNINILKADGELSMKLAADEAAKVEGELQKDKRALKLELKEQVGRGRMPHLPHSRVCQGSGFVSVQSELQRKSSLRAGSPGAGEGRRQHACSSQCGGEAAEASSV